MRGVKKCGVLLALFIISLFTLSQCSDVNALKYQYDGLTYFNPILPACLDNGNVDWNFNSCSNRYSNMGNFEIQFSGDSFDSNYLSDFNVKNNFAISDMSFNSNTSKYQYGNIEPIFGYNFSTNNDSLNIVSYGSQNNGGFNLNSYFPSKWNNLSDDAKSLTIDDFNSSELNLPAPTTGGFIQCNPRINGVFCGGLWNTADFINTQLNPRRYTSDGLYLHSSAKDEKTGLVYNNVFKFSDLFNKPIGKFSSLKIPLWTYENFYLNPDNLTENSQFKYNIQFNFDSPISWHDNISSNGSFIRIAFQGLATDGSVHTQSSNCTGKQIMSSFNDNTKYTLVLECPIILDYNYLWIVPYFEINGNNQYVWDNSTDFSFSLINLVTNNDETPAPYDFNSNLKGSYIAGDAKNNIPPSNPLNDIFENGVNVSQSLISLFGFTFLNPFAPLFNLFNNQDSCVHIPIIAGMIHAESDEVCPWFPATVRNIATPVMGIASVMLVFGFAVRWLGSGSGNLLDDVIKNDTVKGDK